MGYPPIPGSRIETFKGLLHTAGLSSSDGTGNYLDFYAGGEFFSIEFMLNSKYEFDMFNELINIYRDKGVKVKIKYF